jgi:hypothetical protein
VAFWSADAGAGSALLVWQLVGVIVLGLVVFGYAGSPQVLTREGSLAREHLEGIRQYLELAEADRIRMLQSPTGAERVPLADAPAAAAMTGAAMTGAAMTGPDPELVLRVTERLLPYAVLFGHEREWSDELAALYAARGEQPGWYSGRSGFNAVAFSSGVSAFTSASSSSWSGSSSSSSSGGSGGGGSSGGGGGGGGGGGV